jgi:ABC-type transporter Mla subunit MlaD
MQTHKNEITTGILVLLTAGIFFFLLIIIGLPGVLKPLNTYRIYYDNANGIRPGAPVLLAGREIGKVTALHSPVLLANRPTGHPDCEVSVDVEVSRDAPIYCDATAHLTQQGLMGQPVIDFVHEDAGSGLATNHTEFVGERIPDISESVSGNMDRLFGPGSDLTETIRSAKTFMQTLNNAHIEELIDNTEQFTGILKREPWRLIWPGSKNESADPKEVPERKKAKVLKTKGS